MTPRALVSVGIACLCMTVACQSLASPLEFGSLDEESKEKHKKAQEMINALGMDLSMDSDDIVRIGSGYAVDEDETIPGDVVIIGGGLTVEGTIEGDAVVIGGSMCLASTAVIDGDAAVVSGLLEREDGAIVKGEIMEKTGEFGEFKGFAELGEGRLDDVVKFGKNIYIEEGEIVEGDVVAIGGTIRIDGSVTGDVVATAGDIEIGSTAEVLGDIVATFGKVRIEPGAITEGEVIEIDMGGAHAVMPEVTFDEYGEEKYPGDEKVTYIISLHDAEAEEIRLTGTFVNWDPDGIEMKRDEEGTWMTTVSLPPGKHMYKFIVDGEWIADPDEPDKRVPDGKGGYATSLIVKSRVKMKVPKGKFPGQTIIFSLDRPDLDDVRVTGSWMGWDSDGIKMKQDKKGKWSVSVPLPAGAHMYKFYVDGEWVPDPDVDETIVDRTGRRGTAVVSSPKGDQGFIKFLHHRPDVDDMRITGSFNDWNPEGIPMYKDEDGTWWTYVAFEPGTYQYKFYIDGEWVADPDTPEKQVPDGKGGYATEFKVKAPRKRTTVRVKTVGGKHEDFSPMLDYNRVDGLYLGARLKNDSNTFPIPQYYIEGGYSFKRERWMYTFELEQPVAPNNMLSIGGSIYEKTDTYDRDLITDEENLIVASIRKQDYRDYFDRRGATGFVALRPWKSHTVKVSYSKDDYRPLETRAHSALFRKDREFKPNPQTSQQICYDLAGCQVCKDIEIASMTVFYELDSRGIDGCCAETPTTGSWLRLWGEWADRDWGGDLGYARYSMDSRNYIMVSPKQQVAWRFKVGLMDLTDECPCVGIPEAQYFFPKQFYVGGIGTLPAYGYKQFKGTHMVLANVEYSIGVGKNFSVVFFSDAGDAKGIVPRDEWDVDDIWDDLKIKFDAGVGLRHEERGEHSITLGVAKGLTKLYDGDDRPVIMTVRASRMF